jgi:hypothetical protein
LIHLPIRMTNLSAMIRTRKLDGHCLEGFYGRDFLEEDIGLHDSFILQFE